MCCCDDDDEWESKFDYTADELAVMTHDEKMNVFWKNLIFNPKVIEATLAKKGMKLFNREDKIDFSMPVKEREIVHGSDRYSFEKDI